MLTSSLDGVYAACTVSMQCKVRVQLRRNIMGFPVFVKRAGEKQSDVRVISASFEFVKKVLFSDYQWRNTKPSTHHRKGT